MVVKRWAPSRSRTRTAAFRMSATSCVERAWTGSFRGAVAGRRGRRGRDTSGLRTRIPNANEYSYSWIQSGAIMNDATKTQGTIDSPRVAALIARLFDEAKGSDAKMREMFGAMPPEECARRMSDPNADYRGF